MASSDAGMPVESEYQVFLSFRGSDTRTEFTSFLYHSLINAGICVFRDDDEIHAGEKIGESLQQAIDNSRIYIPIFSRTYAESQWCLRELAQIVANTSRPKVNKQILPIFFDVDPKDVKLNTPLYRNAIVNLEREKKLTTEQVNAWREALVKVAEIKGWEVKNYNDHGEFINLVVEEVVEKLKIKHRSVPEYLVGIDDQVASISELLDVNSGGVRFIPIYGMGGIGKTTLAKVVFNKFSSSFENRCCFLEGVQAKSSRDVDLIELQKMLLSEISHSAGTKNINTIDYGMRRSEEVLRRKKVLLVLDDVGNKEQVEKLVGKGTLYSGSRILITTRNKDVCQIRRPKEDKILPYEMELMSHNHALQLFSNHAFDRDSPLDEYRELSEGIVSATGRLPLALEVIGSLLYHKKKQKQWKKTLEDLRKAPHDGVSTKLRISYDTLSPEQQQIFLDIACFFIGENKTNAIYLWEDCGLLRYDGVDILHSMCLIKIIKNKFWMHDQLRDLGRAIVCNESMNPKEHSRLWIHEDIIDIITTEEMKKNKFVQTLDIDLHKSDLKDVKSEEIERFESLRCLKLNGGTFVSNSVNCLTKLRWIFWSHPPPSSKSANMHFKNVVVLQISNHDYMNGSMLQSLIEMATKLKVLSIESCPSITTTPNFSKCLKLERLSFICCSNLEKIDDSIGKLKCLIKLKIDNCHHLKELPEEIGNLLNLEYFFVKAELVKQLPDSIWELKSLRKLCFFGWVLPFITDFWELPSAIKMLQNLEVLIIHAGKLGGRLPPEIGSFRHLRILDLTYAGLEVPKSIGTLPCLQRLELRQCNHIQELPALPTSLTHLLVSAFSLREIPDLSNLTNLVELELSGGGGEWELFGGQGLRSSPIRGIGRLSKLTKLSLERYNVSASTELASLHQLKELYLYGLDQQTFLQLPSSLQKLGLNDFNSVESNFPILRDLLYLQLFNSPVQELQLDGLQLPHLRDLDVHSCGLLKRLSLSNMRKLTNFSVTDCSKLVEIRFSWSFESLEYLHINFCPFLEKLLYVGEAGPDNKEFVKEMITCEGTLILPSEALKQLRLFALESCSTIKEIHVVGTLESWEGFVVHGCQSLRSLRGLENLRNLRDLVIRFSSRLQVVEGLDELEFLNRLHVRDCESLERLIDVSTTKVPNDCHIYIYSCEKLCGVEKAFEGSLQSFKHYKQQESDLEREQEQEQEQESDLETEQELMPRRWLGRVSIQQEQELESLFKQEQEPEGHFKQELDLKPTRRQGVVSFQCLSFLHCILPCFFPLH